MQPFRSSWPFYNSLAFLKDHISGPKDTCSNLVVVDEGQDGELVKEWVTKKTPKKASSEETLLKVAEQIVEKIPSQPLSSPKRQKLSDDEHFGQTIARLLSKFQDGEEKEMLKLEIQMLIHSKMYGRRPQFLPNISGYQQINTPQVYNPYNIS